MSTLTPQQFASLPPQIIAAIADPATYDKVTAIAKHHELDSVEEGMLAQVTGSLLSGTLGPTEFVNTLIDYLAVPREKAAYIAQDINRDIFNPVKDALKEVHQVVSVTANSAPQSAKTDEPKKVEGIALWKTYQSDMASVGGAKNEEEKPGSILEQKLGGTFRMSSTHSAPAGGAVPTGLAPTKPVVSPIQMHKEVLQKPTAIPMPQSAAIPKPSLPTSIQAQFSGVPPPKQVIPPAPQQTVPPASGATLSISAQATPTGLSGMLSGVKPFTQTPPLSAPKPPVQLPSGVSTPRPVPRPPIGTALAPAPMRTPVPISTPAQNPQSAAEKVLATLPQSGQQIQPAPSGAEF